MKPEVIVNLWYVHDGEFIFSLRGRAYAAIGTDDSKLALLQERASLDYLVAQPFDVPAAFWMTIEGTKQPITLRRVFDDIQPPTALFEEVLRTLEAGFPIQSNLRVPDDALVCITPLLGDEDGNIKVAIGGSQHFDGVRG